MRELNLKDVEQVSGGWAPAIGAAVGATIGGINGARDGGFRGAITGAALGGASGGYGAAVNTARTFMNAANAVRSVGHGVAAGQAPSQVNN